MIRVQIELVPANGGYEKQLFLMEICNIGGTPQRGEYRCHLWNEQDDTTQVAHITGWPRKQRDAAALVHEALSRMGYGREV